MKCHRLSDQREIEWIEDDLPSSFPHRQIRIRISLAAPFRLEAKDSGITQSSRIVSNAISELKMETE